VSGGVFISYAAEDGALAQRVHRDLERASLTAWRYERNGKPGVDFVQEIRQQIDRCSCFLLIDSPSARASRYVRDECRQIAERLSRDTPMPKRFVCLAQPDGPWRGVDMLFANDATIRYIDLSPSQSNAYDQGIRSVCADLDVTYTPEFVNPRDVDFLDELRAEADRRIKSGAWNSGVQTQLEMIYGLVESFRKCFESSDWVTAEAQLRTIQFMLGAIGAHLLTPLLALGVLYGEMNRDADAEAAFDAAVKLKPQDPRAWAGLGATRVLRQQYRESLDAYERAIELLRHATEPLHVEARPQVYYNAAFVAGLAGEPRRAVGFLDAADRCQPSNALVLALRGHILLQMGDVVAGYDAMELAIDARPRATAAATAVLLELADCAGQLGDREKEHQLLTEALQTDCGAGAVGSRSADAIARRARIRRGLANLCAREGRFDRAIDWLDQAIGIDPQSIQLHAERALALDAMDRSFERDREIDWCVERTALTPRDHYYIGLAYHLGGHATVAAEHRRQSRSDALVKRWAEYDELLMSQP
jgi:tetratricopeptide (TPR) repeat protein